MHCRGIVIAVYFDYLARQENHKIDLKGADFVTILESSSEDAF